MYFLPEIEIRSQELVVGIITRGFPSVPKIGKFNDTYNCNIYLLISTPVNRLGMVYISGFSNTPSFLKWLMFKVFSHKSIITINKLFIETIFTEILLLSIKTLLVTIGWLMVMVENFIGVLKCNLFGANLK